MHMGNIEDILKKIINNIKDCRYYVLKKIEKLNKP